MLPLTEKGLSELPESVTAGAAMPPMASPLWEEEEAVEEEEEEEDPLLALPPDSLADAEAVELLPSAVAACWELPFCPFVPLPLPVEDEEPDLEDEVADEGVAAAC